MKRKYLRLDVCPVRVFGFAAVVICAGAVPAAAFSLANALNAPAPSVVTLHQSVSLPPALSPPANTDPCLPLLTSVLEDDSSAYAPYAARKAAAFSMAFGLRMAIGPLERTGSIPLQSVDTGRLDIDPAVTARSITAYRHCQKEQALRQPPHPAVQG